MAGGVGVAVGYTQLLVLQKENQNNAAANLIDGGDNTRSQVIKEAAGL